MKHKSSDTLHAHVLPRTYQVVTVTVPEREIQETTLADMFQ